MYSERLRRRAAALMEGVPAGVRVVLRVAPEQVSAMTGQRRKNIDALTSAFSLEGLTIAADPSVDRGRILVDWTK